MSIRPFLRRITASFLLACGYLIWSGMTLGVCWWVWGGIVRQIRANSYPHVAGEITKSEVERKGGHWDLHFRYIYRIDGIEYDASTYRFLRAWSNEKAERIVKSLPPGQIVDVYYDPRRPGDALLQPGLIGSDLFSAMATIPFAAVMYIGWWRAFRKWRFRATGGVPIRDDGTIARLGPSPLDPVAAAVFAAGIAAFPLLFVMMIFGSEISFSIAVIPWLLVLAAAVSSCILSIRRALSGVRELVIDRANERLTLPVMADRPKPLTIPWWSIVGVEIEHCTRLKDYQFRPGRFGHGPPIFPFYVPVVLLMSESTGAMLPDERVIGPLFESEARCLAEWLRGQIRR